MNITSISGIISKEKNREYTNYMLHSVFLEKEKDADMHNCICHRSELRK